MAPGGSPAQGPGLTRNLSVIPGAHCQEGVCVPLALLVVRNQLTQ